MEAAATIASNVIEELRWRGLVHNITEGAEAVLASQKISAYIGFDPTADSLHVGSLLPIMVLVHLQRHGHHPIALVGGGTGMIGDPSGKTKERQLLDEDTLGRNIAGIREQLAKHLKFEGVPNPARLLNNADWLLPLHFIGFLRDVGKHFTVNYMIAKDSVKQRLNSEEGISFTEFSYMLLQSFDFLTLFEEQGCSFQFGGSDQWGNITAGIELIRRMNGGQAHGVTVPLVTSSSGVKFGKTEAGTIWLDGSRTSPFRFFQFWMNTADSDVMQYLKFFTLLGREEIEAIEAEFTANPGGRAAQRRLAEEVTRRVHGEAALERAQAATQVLFGGSLSGLSSSDLLDIFADVPSSSVSAAQLAAGLPLIDLVTQAGFENSKARARQLVEGGGVSVNNQRVEEVSAVLTPAEAIDGQVLILRKGKKQYHLLRVEA